MIKTLEMSTTDAYMVISTHLRNDNPLKPQKPTYVHRATPNMWKEDTLIFLQMGEKHLEKTHVMSLNVCDDSMQDHGRLQNLGVG